ncbi:alpha/beta hydrolase [Gymnodinialimonas sp. 2305UL16-5]|uniref:alpha/beta fold hydrolase n=1 Tax=Gymnodinialimonas mytili TaxID=3126503 RepID=UPI0030A2EDF8
MKALFWILGLLAIAAIATLWRASVREAAAEAAHPPAGQFIEVNGTRVHYVDEGDGPPVVLIHGASGNVNDWTFDMVGRLSGSYRVLAFDRPGLGYTDMIGRNASAADQARLLADAAIALGAQRPIVVGHSYGGAVALAWALERRDNIAGLVNLAGASNPWEGGQGTYYALLGNSVSGPAVAALLSAWVPDATLISSIESVFTPQPAPEGFAEHYGPGLILRRFSLLENARQRTGLLPQIEAMVPRYGEIDMPVEILHGDADLTVPLQVHSEPLSTQIPGANLVVMEGVGHMPHHADPQAVVDAIDRVAIRAGLRQ